MEDLPQAVALLLLLYPSGYAHIIHRRHKHQRAARQGDVGSDSCPLGTHRILGYLHQYVLAGPQQICDLAALGQLLQTVILIPGEEHISGI